MRTCTHYFKEPVYRDGVRYQHVVGLDEVYDWRLILDLSGDPSWTFVTVEPPAAPASSADPRGTGGLFRSRKKKCRCPVCRGRLLACEERYPNGVSEIFPLSSRPQSLERWHDGTVRCPYCDARLGFTLPALPALPEPGGFSRRLTDRTGKVRILPRLESPVGSPRYF